MRNKKRLIITVAVMIAVIAMYASVTNACIFGDIAKQYAFKGLGMWNFSSNCGGNASGGGNVNVDVKGGGTVNGSTGKDAGTGQVDVSSKDVAGAADVSGQVSGQVGGQAVGQTQVTGQTQVAGQTSGGVNVNVGGSSNSGCKVNVKAPCTSVKVNGKVDVQAPFTKVQVGGGRGYVWTPWSFVQW